VLNHRDDAQLMVLGQRHAELADGSLGIAQ
jgi:hypothetical protein